MLCKATPDISSSSENINGTSRISICFMTISSKEISESNETIPIDSAPTKIVTIGLEAYSKTFSGVAQSSGTGKQNVPEICRS